MAYLWHVQKKTYCSVRRWNVLNGAVFFMQLQGPTSTAHTCSCKYSWSRSREMLGIWPVFCRDKWHTPPNNNSYLLTTANVLTQNLYSQLQYVSSLLFIISTSVSSKHRILGAQITSITNSVISHDICATRREMCENAILRYKPIKPSCQVIFLWMHMWCV